MKRLILVMVFALSGILTAQAQMWLGGSVNATINKETKTFSIAPDAGYCFANTPFSIGCAVEYAGTLQEGEAYTHSLTVSPYFRYDICDINERFSLFMDLTSDIDVLKFNSFEIGFSPGVSINLTEHWSAEFSYGFLGYQREKDAAGSIEQNFVLNFAMATSSFGIYYNF